MRFLLTRPIIDGEKTATLLLKLNHHVHVDPLLEIKRIETPQILFDQYQAIIFTSPNALRSFDYPVNAKSILTFAVGKKTEKTAKDLGFKHIICGNGNSKDLSGLIQSMIFPKNGPILYLSGNDVAGTIEEDLKAAFFNVDVRKIYKAGASESMNEDTLKLLAQEEIDYIPFYSPRSAHIFIELIKKAKMEKKLEKISALCLSPAIAEVISTLKWEDILISTAPNQAALYSLIDIELEGLPNDR